MSVPSNLNKHVYNGNGVTTSWSFTFPVILTTDIQVILTDTNGVDQAPLTSNYSVDTTAGTVTYPSSGSPLPSGWKITLLRVEPITQLTTLTTQGAFTASNIERALDKAIMILQQHDEQFSRVPAYPVSTTPSSTDTTSFINTVAAYAATAAAGAATLTGTSTTSNTVGTGSKTFTTQSGKTWATGQFILVVDSANSANYMHGQIISYTSTTLVVNVLDVGGSGTKTSWNIFLAGTQGSTGATGAAGATTVRGTFTNANLTAGVLTITHNGGLASPYVLNVYIYNNSGVMVFADQVNTFTTNSCKVDLTSYGTISGTWSYSYVL